MKEFWKTCIHLHWLSAALAFVLVTFSSALLWQMLLEQETAKVIKQTHATAVNLSALLEQQMSFRLLAINRMAIRWSSRVYKSKHHWLTDAQQYIQDIPGVQALEWVDEKYVVRWIEPMQGNEAALDLDLSKEEKRYQALQKSRETKQIILSSPVSLVQGGTGFLAFFPLFGPEQQFEGFIIGVIRYRELLALVVPKHIRQQFSIEISVEGVPVYQHANNIESRYLQNQPVQTRIANSQWIVQLHPLPSYRKEFHTPHPYLVLIFGVLLAALSAISVYLLLRQFQQIKMLNEQHLALKQSNDDLQSFAFIASHDLQEPLRIIGSYASLLQRRYAEQLDEKANKFLNYMSDGAQRLQTMINDLLDYARVETQGKPLVSCDLNDVLSTVLESLQDNFSDHQVQLTSDELPTVLGDAVQLQQLFLNLLSNAIKYRGGERLNILIKAQPLGRMWHISVTDNGIGIDEIYFEKIFQVFQRLHASSSIQGSGIGLAICKRIIDRHGGKIWLESIPNSGSSFHFTLQTA